MEIIGIVIVGLFFIFAIWSGISAQSSTNRYGSVLQKFNDIKSTLEVEERYVNNIDYPALLKRLEKELSEALETKKWAYNERFNNKHYHTESIPNKVSINSEYKISELKCFVLERDICKVQKILGT